MNIRTFVASLSRNLQCNFPKIHPIWKRDPSLINWWCQVFPTLFLPLPWDSYDFATLRRQSECTESLKNRFVPRPLHTYGWCWWLAWLAWTNFVGWVNSLYRKLLVDRMKNGPVPSYCGPRPPSTMVVMMIEQNITCWPWSSLMIIIVLL